MKFKNILRKIKFSNKAINKNISIISSNCIGGFVSHDFSLRFNSPFVNLFMKPKDFISLLYNLEYYMNCELKFIKEKGINYPIGLLPDNIRIYFMHYKTEQDALLKWNQRKKRINYSNIFVIFTDRDGCTYDDLVNFDNLPYINKIVFTSKKYDDIKTSIFLKRYENEKCVGLLHKYQSIFSLKRIYDEFDFYGWLSR